MDLLTIKNKIAETNKKYNDAKINYNNLAKNYIDGYNNDLNKGYKALLKLEDESKRLPAKRKELANEYKKALLQGDKESVKNIEAQLEDIDLDIKIYDERAKAIKEYRVSGSDEAYKAAIDSIQEIAQTETECYSVERELDVEIFRQIDELTKLRESLHENIFTLSDEAIKHSVNVNTLRDKHDSKKMVGDLLAEAEERYKKNLELKQKIIPQRANELEYENWEKIEKAFNASIDSKPLKAKIQTDKDVEIKYLATSGEYVRNIKSSIMKDDKAMEKRLTAIAEYEAARARHIAPRVKNGMALAMDPSGEYVIDEQVIGNTLNKKEIDHYEYLKEDGTWTLNYDESVLKLMSE